MRPQTLSLFILAATACPLSASPEETKPGGVDTQPLEEVRYLGELPGSLAAALGRKKGGPEGMADAGESFNSTGVGNNRLPLRRFVIGGLSEKSALVAYEEGGPRDAGHPWHARAYVLDNSAWRKTAEWALYGNPFTLRDLVLRVKFAEEEAHPDRVRGQQRIQKTYPTRRDGPLREANISDDEVREIQAVSHGVVPDSLVYISGVVTGCACEDGPGCSDQVWIVAHRPGLMKGLQLSRINGRWVIGPVQQWWLELENLQARRGSFSSWADFLTEQGKLYERFPACSGPSAAATAAPVPPRGPR
jgi:hypothetical protein